VTLKKRFDNSNCLYDIVETGEKMRRTIKSFGDTSFLAAALQGLEMQKTRIEEQIEQVRSMLGHRPGTAGASAQKPVRRRRLSVAARKRIAVAQKRRWAEYRKKAAAAKQG
jgi:hypothetical protein